MLKIYNTLHRKKEIFKPINPKKINIYICGVTPYDFCHIGHGRTFIIFDMIIRYFKHIGYEVNYIRNITDIDDKIINQAILNKKTIFTLTNDMIKAMNKDFKLLNLILPNFEPKVTECITEIINFIKKLIKKNHAYIAKNGDVMFNIKTYKNYGCLSHQKINYLKLNTRINVSSKVNCEDFVLWKYDASNQTFNFKSPWGYGRPGWHIECSAMSYKYFGKKFDIHGGGSDLIFPHHENEIAQSVCAYDSESYPNYWIHSGMVMLNSVKMSKSLGNVFILKNILKKYDSETIRYFALSSHYRKPINCTLKSFDQAESALRHLYKALNNTHEIEDNTNYTKEYDISFCNAMNNDFNTPKAYSILFKIAQKINFYKKNRKDKIVNLLATKLRKLGNILGLLNNDSSYFLNKKTPTISTIELDQINELIIIRNNARKEKNWILADKIRERLKKMDILIEDTLKGSFFKKKHK
ncbi:cysteine--tRNA ligase [Candidatus Tachikawaea gelatinosa]|uniref:Cysteine--tRNA ligase n=1 Tax=Candidatus Tachikawaea gelatinosa TaxID=1410383 RepID=A0A090AJV6_9ENTR|nr:cysteine--tRNA ligase [Candidatus Tachikawaea gelatinosa]BAP58743.1 cysteine--tRNA ligase [Candidatus Tachikawaea gelatinosa]